MTDKPSYLGLLNAISIAESQAHAYLTAWAEVTCDADVRELLLRIAAREGEHGMSFAKRINELGFHVQPTDDARLVDQLACVRSDRSDLEKFEYLALLRFDTGDEPDVFDGFFRDHSIDIRTGELLGRYIAEERDTTRQLRCCYEKLRGATAAGDDDRLARLEAKVDAICAAIEGLRGTSEATSSEAGGTRSANGKHKTSVRA
jgi:rubrerythrin